MKTIAKKWGREYGGRVITREGRPLEFRRRGNRVRFYDGAEQVGPEQPHVAAAVAYCMHTGLKL